MHYRNKMANPNISVFNKSIQQVKNSYKEISIIVHYNRRKKQNYIYKSKHKRKKYIQSVCSLQTTKRKLSLHRNFSTIYNNEYYNNSSSEFNFKPALKFNANIDFMYDRKQKQSTLFLGDNKNEMKTWKVYRCQCNIKFVEKEETRCCYCNSDAMFEIMKSLYDCYKKKNCDNCNCILCGQIPRAATKSAEVGKSTIANKAEAEQTKVTADMTENSRKETRAAYILTPLIGNTSSEQEKIQNPCAKNAGPADQKRICEMAQTAGKILPEGTLEELEKTKKDARAAGLLTPSVGETTSEKNEIRKSRAKKAGLAERKRICKAATAAAAGFLIPVKDTLEEKRRATITPSQCKSPSERECIRKSRAKKLSPDEQERLRCEAEAVGLVLPKKGTPEGMAKIKKEVHAAGLLTPSISKIPSEKNKIQMTRAKKGGLFEQERSRCVATAAGLVYSPEEMKKLKKEARAVGLLSQSVEKIPSEKNKIRLYRAKKTGQVEQERIHKTAAAAVLIVPEKRTPPEIEKLKKKARAAGIITPSQGKTPSHKERIRKSRAKISSPAEQEKHLKDAPTAGLFISEKGTPEDIEKLMKKARAAGIITLFQGKIPSVKEVIRKSRAKQVPCDEQQRLKRKAETVEISISKRPVPVDLVKLQKEARAAGILTPSKGKTPSEKNRIQLFRPKKASPVEQEKIRRDAPAEGFFIPAEDLTKLKEKARAAGIITPSQGKTSSEKELIGKSRAKNCPYYVQQRLKREVEGKDIPIYKKAIPGEIEKLKSEARNAGLLTPSVGYTPSEKIRIQVPRSKKSCLAAQEKNRKAGLFILEKGTSEDIAKIKRSRVAKAKDKDLILEKGQETTPAGKIKTKEKASFTSKKDFKLVSGGVKEEIKEDVKTTKCERACGCEKRNISFRHSYIKIKVTSPDVSMKRGLHTDSKGIKVTVGTAIVGNIYSTDCSDIKFEKAEKKPISLEFVYSRKEILNKTNAILPNLNNYDYQDQSEDVDYIMRQQVIEKYIKYQNSLSKIYRCVKSYSDILVNNYNNSTTELYETGYGGYVKTSVKSYENPGSLSLLSISITNSDYTIDESSSSSREFWTTSNLPLFLDIVTDRDSEIDKYTTSDIRSIYSVSVNETNGSSLPCNNTTQFYKKSINQDKINQTTEGERRHFREYDTGDILVFSECEDDESVLEIVQKILSMNQSNEMSSIFIMVPASDISSYCSSTSSGFDIMQTPLRITRISSKTRLVHYGSYGDQTPERESKICKKVVEFDNKVMHTTDNMGTDTCDLLPSCCKALLSGQNKKEKTTKDNKGTGSPTKNKKNEDITTSPLTSGVLLQPPCEYKNVIGCSRLPQNGATNVTENLNKLLNSTIPKPFSPVQKRVYENKGTSTQNEIKLDCTKPCEFVNRNSKPGEDRLCENNLKELIKRVSNKMKEIVSKPKFKQEEIKRGDKLEENDDEDIREIIKNCMQKLKEEKKCDIKKTGLVPPQYCETDSTPIINMYPPADTNTQNIKPDYLEDCDNKSETVISKNNYKEGRLNINKDEYEVFGYRGIKIEVLAKGSASQGLLAIPCVRCLSRVLFNNSQTDC